MQILEPGPWDLRLSKDGIDPVSLEIVQQYRNITKMSPLLNLEISGRGGNCGLYEMQRMLKHCPNKSSPAIHGQLSHKNVIHTVENQRQRPIFKATACTKLLNSLLSERGGGTKSFRWLTRTTIIIYLSCLLL